MNLLILEPPYSHLFKDLSKDLNPRKTFVHLFNLGYLIYLPNIRFVFVKHRLRGMTPSDASLSKVSSIRSLANSNIKSPEDSEVRIMACYLEYLKGFVIENQITHIFCHNDLRWQHAIAREVAKEIGVQIFFSEEGLFRPHTLTFDTKGVNAFSSVPQVPDFYLKHKFESRPEFKPLVKRQMKRALRLFYFINFILLNKLGDLLRVNITLKNKNYSVHQYLLLFISKFKKANLPVSSLKIDRKFIFIPLQVSTDTQTIIHSKFEGTQQVIEIIESAYSQLPEKIKEEYALVFKQHPMESHITYKFQDFSIISTDATGQLITKCSLVVLVNSTTIVEALTKQKRVITLGESHFNIPGLVLQSGAHKLAHDITKTLENLDNPDQEFIQSFLNFLKYNYQVNGNIFYYDKNTINQIKSRIDVKTNY